MLKMTNEYVFFFPWYDDVPTSFQLIRKKEFVYVDTSGAVMFCFFNKVTGFSTTRPEGHLNMDASGIYLIQNDCGMESLY